MRDPNRIPQVLDKIKEIWEKYPDMRLGQLIGNVLEGPNLYYVEDDGLVNALTTMYEGKSKKVNFDERAYIMDLIEKHPEELGFVLEAETYADYVATYETVSDDPARDAELTEAEYLILRNYFIKKEEK